MSSQQYTSIIFQDPFQGVKAYMKEECSYISKVSLIQSSLYPQNHHPQDLSQTYTLDSCLYMEVRFFSFFKVRSLSSHSSPQNSLSRLCCDLILCFWSIGHADKQSKVLSFQTESSVLSTGMGGRLAFNTEEWMAFKSRIFKESGDSGLSASTQASPSLSHEHTTSTTFLLKLRIKLL